MEIEKRLNQITILTTEPPDRFYNHYGKYDDEGRPITNSLKAACIKKNNAGVIGWSDYCISELKKLTDEWLDGDYAGVNLPELVKIYQAGDKACFDVIKGRLYREINYILGAHGLGKNHAVFTLLDGSSAKSPKRKQFLIMKPSNDEYNAEEEQQIDLTYEENFTEADRRALIEHSLKDALNTYQPNKSGFKTWFKIKFNDDVTDLAREYRKGWRDNLKGTLQRYIEKHKTDKTWDFSELYEKLPGDFLSRLDDEQKRLLMVKVRNIEFRYSKKDEAALMGIKKDKYNSITERLEREYLDWIKQNQQQKKKERPKKIEPKNYFNISDPTPYLADNNM